MRPPEAGRLEADPALPLRRTCVPLHLAWPSLATPADSSPAPAPLGPFMPWKRCCVHHPPTRETTMATSTERMRALRERTRCRIRRLMIEVSEDDLRALAGRGGFALHRANNFLTRRKRAPCRYHGE